ncbi:hypothetical protein Leryth_001496 [Lithospermum erythrorhizon]|nr:hypothetical protein Leryth_001496 [Lithospermum erythrorhizon]
MVVRIAGIISHSHDVGSTQTRSSELEENHEDDFGLAADHDAEMDLHGKGKDNVEENGDQEPEHEVDQIHGNEDREMILHEHNNNIAASDEDQIDVIDNQELNENLELALVEDQEINIGEMHEIGLEDGQLILSPSQHVLQVRTMVVSSDYQLHVGQEFSDVHGCRRALRDTAIALHFEMQTIKSDKTEFCFKLLQRRMP